ATKTFPCGSTVEPPACADPGLNSGFTSFVKNVTPPSCDAATIRLRPWLNAAYTSPPRTASTGLSASPVALAATTVDQLWPKSTDLATTTSCLSFCNQEA